MSIRFKVRMPYIVIMPVINVQALSVGRVLICHERNERRPELHSDAVSWNLKRGVGCQCDYSGKQRTVVMSLAVFWCSKQDTLRRM